MGTKRKPFYTKIVSKIDKKIKTIKPIKKDNRININPHLKNCLGIIDRNENVKFKWEK